MSLHKLTARKAPLLFVLLFFCANIMIGQSFFETYSQTNSLITDLSEVSSGLEGKLAGDNPPSFLNVDAAGNFQSIDVLSNLNNTAYTRLPSGNFLQYSGGLFRYYNQNQQLVNNFTVQNPNGQSTGTDTFEEYSNGDLMLTFGYLNNANSDFTVVRINPSSGQIIWQTDIEFGFVSGDPGRGAHSVVSNNESIWISVDNANTINNYFMISITSGGNVVVNVITASVSKFPFDLVADADGGVWYQTANTSDIVTKIYSDGTKLGWNVSQIFQATTSIDVLTPASGGGVMVVGTTNSGSDKYSLKLGADGTTQNQNVLDNLPSQVSFFTTGTPLSSGDYVFGGKTTSNATFLVKLNSNGEYQPGGGGCNVNITSSNGGVTITGLNSSNNSKLFNSSTQIVWQGCNPWNGNPCTSNETVSGLTVGATYFLSVEGGGCSEWIPITIQGGGGGATCSDGIQNQGETGIDCGGPCAPCNTGCNVNITSSNGGVTITGLASNANAKLFNSDVDLIYWGCNPWQGSPCSNNETVSNLIVGATYFLSVQSPTCNEWIPIVIQDDDGCTDSDGDGVCNVQDCQPTNPNLPTTPGTSCNDNNSNTTNDQIQSDGCTCQGTPVGGGCNVSITSSNGGVTITGLASNANTKLFSSNYQVAFSCNPWNGNPCSGTETVSGLTVGATYFLSVQSSSCDEWIPITIQGGGGGNGPDLVTTAPNIGSGTSGQLLTFTFDLTNQGNIDVTGSYFIKSYISTDATYSSDDIQEGTIQTGNTPIGTTNVTGAITVPSYLSPGNYYLILSVDDNGNIAESNENNNIKASLFTITNGGGGGICDNVSNVAQGKSTNQSSTVSAGGVTGSAAKAVDGNTNGNFYSGSVAATNNESQAWWQVDLGAFYQIETIEVFNRTEGESRLNDFYILTADLPFTSNNLATARNQANNEQYYAGQAGTPTTWNFPNGDLVRYVRIQRASQGYVTLAEVRVNGCPPGGMPENITYELTTENEVMTPFSLTKLFPNPTSGELFTQIESSTEGEILIQIVNILGQVKLERKMQVEVGTNTFQLLLENYESGLYNVMFHDGEKLVSKQFVISK